MNQQVSQPRNHRAVLHLKAAHIIVLDEDGGQRQASGFIRREPDGLFLYTCWHVVTGIRTYPLTLPSVWRRRVTLRVRFQSVEKPAEGVEVIGGLKQIEIPLYDADTGAPHWAQDRSDIPNGDLAAVGLRVPFWHDAIKLRFPDIPISDLQVIDESDTYGSTLMLGDKVLIVGYPYGYSALGESQPTPVVLTRFVAATRVSDAQLSIRLMDGAAAEGMSGGPVFIESDSRLYLVGLYTGLIFPDRRETRTTALGTFTDMLLCWTHPETLGLIANSP